MKHRQRGEARPDDIDFLPKKGKTKKDLLFLEVPVSVCLQGNAEGAFFFAATFFSLIISVVWRVHINLFRVVEGNAGIRGGWLFCLACLYTTLFYFQSCAHPGGE